MKSINKIHARYFWWWISKITNKFLTCTFSVKTTGLLCWGITLGSSTATGEGGLGSGTAAGVSVFSTTGAGAWVSSVTAGVSAGLLSSAAFTSVLAGATSVLAAGVSAGVAVSTTEAGVSSFGASSAAFVSSTMVKWFQRFCIKVNGLK